MAGSWVEEWLDDLEREAAAQALVARAEEVEELVRDAYRAVSWADRLRGSEGRQVAAEIVGYGSVVGVLLRVGRDWCLVRGAAVDLVVFLASVATVRGLGSDVVTADAQPVWARLTAGSLMRDAAEDGRAMRLFLVDGAQERGVPVRVGADFVELADSGTGPLVVPWGRIAAFTVL